MKTNLPSDPAQPVESTAKSCSQPLTLEQIRARSRQKAKAFLAKYDEMFSKGVDLSGRETP